VALLELGVLFLEQLGQPAVGTAAAALLGRSQLLLQLGDALAQPLVLDLDQFRGLLVADGRLSSG